MKPRVEFASRPDENVGGHTGAPESLIGEPALLLVRRMGVGYHDHQIIVAIWMVLASSTRTEEVYSIRFESQYERSHDVSETSIRCCHGSRHAILPGSDALTVASACDVFIPDLPAMTSGTV